MQASLYISWEHHCFSVTPGVFFCLHLVLNQTLCLWFSQSINLVLEDDDVAVLDLISRTGGDLMQGRGISGSVAREPNVESYTRDGMLLIQHM